VRRRRKPCVAAPSHLGALRSRHFLPRPAPSALVVYARTMRLGGGLPAFAFACLALGTACAAGSAEDPDTVKKKDSGVDGTAKDTGSPPEDTALPDTAADPDTSTTDSDLDSTSDTTEEGLPPCTTLTAADCVSAALSMASVSGDTGADVRTATGSDSSWYHVTVTENDSSLFSSVDLKVTITLSSPSGENFDLYVCMGKAKGDGGGIECTTVARSSTSSSGDDVVSLTWPDNRPIGGFDDTKVLSIEVRAMSATCDPSLTWSLKVEGHK
jgi:hypothetical protein